MAHNTPRVTGVMLVLNEAFYIKASVYNALQFVDQLLIMDGGSEDGTCEFLKGIEGKDSRVAVIANPQKDKRHYHPSWDQPKRWNKLIELAKHDWVFVLGADECLCDHADLRSLIVSNKKEVCFNFPRYALVDAKSYTTNWWPDNQMRLFNRKACNGLRFMDRARHCTVMGDMGKSKKAPPKKNITYYLVHYHHGFGPKKHALGKGMKIAKLPETFRNPKQAQEYIIEHPATIDYQYDFRLYGKAGFVAP